MERHGGLCTVPVSVPHPPASVCRCVCRCAWVFPRCPLTSTVRSISKHVPPSFITILPCAPIHVPHQSRSHRIHPHPRLDLPRRRQYRIVLHVDAVRTQIRGRPVLASTAERRRVEPAGRIRRIRTQIDAADASTASLCK